MHLPSVSGGDSFTIRFQRKRELLTGGLYFYISYGNHALGPARGRGEDKTTGKRF